MRERSSYRCDWHADQVQTQTSIKWRNTLNRFRDVALNCHRDAPLIADVEMQLLIDVETQLSIGVGDAASRRGFETRCADRVGCSQTQTQVSRKMRVQLRLSSRYASCISATEGPIRGPGLSTVNSLWLFIIFIQTHVWTKLLSFPEPIKLQAFSNIFKDLTVHMAPKAKAIASSCSIATAKTWRGGAPP